VTAKQRYRQRLKLRSALTRLMVVMAENADAGIRPDKTSARLAAQVLLKLVPFAVLGTETDLAELLEGKSDLSRFAAVIRCRKTQTRKRAIRRARS
jgi:hypothetical protein